MGSDDGDAAFKRQCERARISVFRANNLQGVLAAGVGKERQTSLSHAFPEFCISSIVAIDVLAVGQAFHHHGFSGKAVVKFLKGIGAAGMDGDGWEEFFVFAGQFEHVIVGHIGVAPAVEEVAVIIINLFLGQQHNGVQRGGANVSEQIVHKQFVKIG